MVGSGAGEGRGCHCFMGREFPFGKMRKFYRWVMGMAAQQCECATELCT